MGKSYLVTNCGPTEVSGVLPFDFNKARASPYVEKKYFTGAVVKTLVNIQFFNLPSFSHLNVCLPYMYFKAI